MYAFLKFLTLILIGMILLMIYQANTGGSNYFFDIVKTTRNGDKIGHFLLFGLLTLGLNLSLKFKIVRLFSIVPIYLGTVAVSIFVVIEELSQAYFPRRTVDINDLIADAAGIICFTIATIIIHGGVYLYQQKSSQKPTR